jgi:hypothetical protein
VTSSPDQAFMRTLLHFLILVTTARL